MTHERTCIMCYRPFWTDRETWRCPECWQVYLDGPGSDWLDDIEELAELEDAAGTPRAEGLEDDV